MSLADFLQTIFCGPSPLPTRPLRPQAASKPLVPVQPGATSGTNIHTLMAQKLVGQLVTIDRTYGLGLFAEQGKTEKWAHDLAVMLGYNDLDGVSAEFLDKDGKVFYAHTVRVSAAPRSGKPAASAGGLELPILDRQRLAKARLLVHNRGKDRTLYRSQLLVSWSTVERAPYENGHSFASDHTRKTTNNRGEASVHVGDTQRVVLTVVRTGSKGFAFATDASGQLSVFCHPRYAEPGCSFAVGVRISAILIQVPKGIQARDIRAAA